LALSSSDLGLSSHLHCTPRDNVMRTASRFVSPALSAGDGNFPVI